MSDHASPRHFLASLRTHRALLRQLVMRDVLSRYRGSALGLAWSFVIPLLMLAVYTFVFSYVFESRWGAPDESPQGHTARFALNLFAGLILHGFLAENLSRAPGLITSHANYVKKVVFPLEVLPPMLLGSACFHLCMNLGVLLAACLLAGEGPSLLWLWLPAILTPLVLLALAADYLFASLGVFLRDIGQLMQLAVTLLLFMSPVFYPVSALPPGVQKILVLNPLSLPIESLRAVLFAQERPDAAALGIHAALSLLVLIFSFLWFQKTRKAFADVI